LRVRDWAIAAEPDTIRARTSVFFMVE